MATEADRTAENRSYWTAEIGRHRLLYPDEAVIRFLASVAPDRTANTGRLALDVGCGSGRHMRLLADYGFDPVGIDLSAEVLEVAASGLGDIAPRLQQTAFHELDPDAERFDVLIAYGAFMLRSVDETRADLSRAWRLLSPGGAALINFRRPQTWFNGLGEQIGETYWRLDARAGAYAGSNYLFLETEASTRLVAEAGFDIVNAEQIDLWKRNRTERNSWDVYWLRRP